MVVVIFGIQGVGKSSITKGVVDIRKDFERIHWGHYAIEAAKLDNLASDIDEVRKLPVREQKRLQLRVARNIANTLDEDRNKNYIIETHSALKTRQGYIPGLTPEILEMLKPELFIVIESDASDIYHRRVLDETRKRDHDKTLADIQLNLDTTKWFATNYTIFSNASFMVVKNVEDNLDYAVNEVVDAINIYEQKI